MANRLLTRCSLIVLLGIALAGCSLLFCAKSQPYPSPVRALYLPARMLNVVSLPNTFAMVQKAGIQALVVDIKDVWGTVSIPTPHIPLATFGPDYERLDTGELLRQAKARGIYLIARIALFQDACLLKKRPEWGTKKADGTPYVTFSHSPCGDGGFVSPFFHEAWEYHLHLALEAARLGFDEIQLDYVRFPDEVGLQVPGEKLSDGADPYAHRISVITEGVAYIRRNLPPQVALSADVFGFTVIKPYSNIGQDIAALAPYLTAVCPMIYPSLWQASDLQMNVPPEQDPGTAIARSLQALRKLHNIPPSLTIRPWLQTGDWYTIFYGPTETQAQIRAALDEGITEWSFWDASGKYDPAAVGFE